MKNALIAAIAIAASGLLYYIGVYQNEAAPENSPAVEEKRAAPSVKDDSARPQVATPPEAATTSSSSSSQSAPQLMGLTPEEMQRLASWSEARGHYIDERFFGDYLTMSTETLTAIAHQDDPKAHLELANRIISKQPFYKTSAEDFDKAAQHLYQASVLGYTSSLEKLSELMMRKAFSDTKTRDDFLIESYKYLYIDAKRGALSSDERLSALKAAHPLTDEQNKQAIERAEYTYQELSALRAEKRLPPFENETPEDLLRIEAKLRDYYSKLTPQR